MSQARRQTSKPPPATPRHGVRSAASQRFREAIGPSSAVDCLLPLLARARRRPGAIILMYHSVADTEEATWIDPANHVPARMFRRQMEFLAAHRKTVPLVDLVDLIRSGRSPQPETVAITFDDGYLDNLTVAAPILDQLGLPSTLFLATGSVDCGRPQWIDETFSIFRFRTRHKLRWALGDTGEFDLSVPTSLCDAYAAVRASLLPAPPDQRHTLLNSLRDQLLPDRIPPRLTLDWSDVSTLASQYPRVGVAGHSVNHSDLTTLTEDQAFEEIAASNEAVGTRTGRPVRLFSFPYGRSSATVRHAAERAGVVGACGGGAQTVIDASCDPLALRRVPAPRSLGRFDFLTSSANTGILHRLFN